MSADTIYQLLVFFPIFLLSLSIHEAAHAYAAKWGGDLTAAYQGRTSLNPIVHIDPIGTLLLPLLAIVSGAPLIGWAKPVPVVESNYIRGRNYGVIVALAGPMSNILIAGFATFVLQAVFIAYRLEWLPAFVGPTQAQVALDFFIQCIAMNVGLAFFNMLPIPPLDGSYILWYGFVQHRRELWAAYFAVMNFGFFILLALSFTGILKLYFTATVQPAVAFALEVAVFPLQFLTPG